jgi:hypothetical protein
VKDLEFTNTEIDPTNANICGYFAWKTTIIDWSVSDHSEKLRSCKIAEAKLLNSTVSESVEQQFYGIPFPKELKQKRGQRSGWQRNQPHSNNIWAVNCSHQCLFRLPTKTQKTSKTRIKL